MYLLQHQRLIPTIVLPLCCALAIKHTTASFAQEPTIHWVPASPEPEEVELADGSRLQLAFLGDGEVNWYQDPDGYTAVRSGEKLKYARLDTVSGQLVATPHDVGTVNPRDLGLQPFAAPLVHKHSHEAPRDEAEETVELSGTIPVMVLLIRFADHKERKLPDAQAIYHVLNEPGGHKTLAPGGSLYDFVQENSYGKLKLASLVLPKWIDLPEAEKYYTDGTRGTDKKRSRLHEAFRFALDYVDENVSMDFGNFDSNKDGFVDGVKFITSGYSGANGRIAPDRSLPQDRIWPHQSWMPRWTSKKGTSVSHYTINPAFHGVSNQPVRLGLLAHEAAHLANLPDLYDMSNRASGVGAWSCLGFHWGFERSGHYPPHLDPWAKAKLGWLKPREVTESGEYQLKNVESHPDVIKISAGFPDGEYLLIENRQPLKFHSHLPSGSGGVGGLAIWHVDENVDGNWKAGHPSQEGWPMNGVHYKVALLQADGRYDLESRISYSGDGDDLFRAGHVDKLLPWQESKSYPSTDPYQHHLKPGIRITNISKSQAVMTFRVEFPHDSTPAGAASTPPSIANYTPSTPQDVGASSRPQPLAQSGPALSPQGTAAVPQESESQNSQHRHAQAGAQKAAQETKKANPVAKHATEPGVKLDTTTSVKGGQLVTATLPSDKTYTVDRSMVILKVQITLAADSNVHMSAKASSVCSGNILTGFSDTGDSSLWPESKRWNTTRAPRRSQLQSLAMKPLKAGTHELRWKVLIADGGKIEFDEGATFTVQAIPAQ